MQAVLSFRQARCCSSEDLQLKQDWVRTADALLLWWCSAEVPQQLPWSMLTVASPGPLVRP